MAKAKKAKAPKPKKVPKSDTADLGHNLGIDPDKRELFLSDLRKWEVLDKAAKDAGKARREFEKQIKEDGFLLAQIQLGSQLSTPEGEAEFTEKTANLLMAAQYVGAAIGTQLALFLSPDRTPSVDIAMDEGVQDCIEGKVARPGYDPSTPQYKSYLKGFADEQERRVKAGITKLEAPKGYIPMTAEELDNQHAEAKKAGANVGR